MSIKAFIISLFMLSFVSSCGSENDGRKQQKEKRDAPDFKHPAATVLSPLGTACSVDYRHRFAALNFEADRATPALLSVIGWAEGLGNCYHYSFTYQPFDSFARHPGVSYCVRGLCSTAAGRYQFLKSTWEQLASKEKLPSFEPRYQDQGALALIRERQISDYDHAYDFPRFKRAMSFLGPVWASLPGSPYGQATRSLEDAWQRYQDYLEEP